MDFLTADEEKQFNNLGYFVVKNVLSNERVSELSSEVDRVHKAKSRPGHRLLLTDFLQYSPKFLDLIDNPKVLPKIGGILGFNISLYFTQMIVTPSALKVVDDYVFRPGQAVGWHQDGQFVNQSIIGPRPRLSLKAAFYLTDCERAGTGNMIIIPGDMKDEEPDNKRKSNAIPLCVNKGDVVIFDRRLWHTSGDNFSGRTRKVLFLGYGHRWLAAADDMTVSQYYPQANPVKKQLLRYKKRGNEAYNPVLPGDLPLKDWMQNGHQKTKSH